MSLTCCRSHCRVRVPGMGSGAGPLRTRLPGPILALGSILALAISTGAAMGAETTVRVAGGDWDSLAPSLSADSRFVAFTSGASNLVSGAGHLVSDVFLSDRQAGTVRCLSITPGGSPGNADSDSPAVCATGRFVAFRSYASNLVPNDTNGVEDVFVRDTLTNVTTRVSVDAAGGQANAWSDAPAISADGRFIAFSSAATNLAPNDTNGVRDIFVRDTVSHQTLLVSRGPAGAPANGGSTAPSISGDGRFVAFTSTASNLVSDDANGVPDVFVADRLTGTMLCASRGADGRPANSDSDSAAVSPDGSCVAFRSYATDLVPGDTPDTPDVFLYERATAKVVLVSATNAGGFAPGASGSPAPSADGRTTAFVTRAALAPDDANSFEDVYVRDRIAGTTTLASRASSGSAGGFWSTAPAISQDGAYVAFASYAANLVANDTNDMGDVFIRGPLAVALTPADVAFALRVAGGMWPSSTFSLARLNVDTGGTSAGVIDLRDAEHILRSALGLTR